MIYRVGDLGLYPKFDETTYDAQSDAEAAAIALSYADSPIGIWDEHGDLVAIVYQQQTFWP